MHKIKPPMLVFFKKMILSLAIFTFMIITISCSKMYDVLFINYTDQVLVINTDYKKDYRFIGEVERESTFFKRAGFSNVTSLDTNYYILNKKGETLNVIKLNIKTFRNDYYVYDDTLIIIEIR